MKLLVIILIVLSLAVISYAQNTLIEILSRNKHGLNLSDGGLPGDGARFLINEAKSAQFFLIGKPHGISELPAFTSVLFGTIKDYIEIYKKHADPKIIRFSRSGEELL